MWRRKILSDGGVGLYGPFENRHLAAAPLQYRDNVV